MKEPKFGLSIRALAVLAAVSFPGCDNHSSTTRPTTAPAVAITTSLPLQGDAVVASALMRPLSTLCMDGRDVQFPAAKLAVIDRKHGGITLRLCSDDPPAALDPGYSGNSFVLDMKLAIDQLKDLSASTWDYKPTDAADTNNGIFIHGARDQFQPAEVHVTFEIMGDEIMTSITGVFLHNDMQNPGASPDRIQVVGTLRSPKPAD